MYLDIDIADIDTNCVVENFGNNIRVVGTARRRLQTPRVDETGDDAKSTFSTRRRIRGGDGAVECRRGHAPSSPASASQAAVATTAPAALHTAVVVADATARQRIR